MPPVVDLYLDRNWIQVTLEFMEDRITELVGLDQERNLVPNLHDIGLRRSVLTSSRHKGSDILNCYFGDSEYTA